MRFKILPAPGNTQKAAISILFVVFCGIGGLLSLRLYCDVATVDSMKSGIDSGEFVNRARELVDADAAPAILLTAAQGLDLSAPESVELAKSLTAVAARKAPARPLTWAFMAYLEAYPMGKLGEAGTSAIRRSFEVCGYCDEDLIKWRLEFVLSHWADIDEDLKLSAFESADFLRWWHLEYDYLDALRASAEEAGIPFSEYQRKIRTPVRPNELPAAEP